MNLGVWFDESLDCRSSVLEDSCIDECGSRDEAANHGGGYCCAVHDERSRIVDSSLGIIDPVGTSGGHVLNLAASELKWKSYPYHPHRARRDQIVRAFLKRSFHLLDQVQNSSS